MDPGDLNNYKDKFDAVWRRVMSESAKSNPQYSATRPNAPDAELAQAARLRKFMDDEANDAQLYGLLASMFSGRARGTLCSIAANERYHLKKLRTQYFIRTGKTYRPPRACPFIRSAPETLRLKVMDEAEGARAYQNAANETGYDDLAETYRRLASDEMRHAQMLSDIIESLF